ncbi:MAG: hypothetical protein GWN00_39800, partial [Aliifodinibius sp.]|nr:hypothetical protein [Phycisphaerae bacterium]NIT62125.1 hypothetical protein [Fodinibius sp.]NIV10977.1 hypothetical protein [Fodinibius sp.]NIY30705.1 hypothetical protein [Fodinibius sp.]
MATTYYANMGGTRILSIDAATDHSGSDDNNVSNFSGDEFIVAINIWSGNKETPSSTYKLKWQDDTDASGYADLGATGELNYTITDSSWSHGDAVATGDQVCDSQGGDTRIAGERVKGQSLSDAIDLADDEQSELWFGVNCEGADGSHAYSFQLYSTAEGAVVGTCGATITMAAGLTHYDLVCSGGTFAYSGSVADLLKGYHLDCAGATFAYAGSDATFKRGYHLDAGV